jgi:hypothetical protein
MIPTTQQLQQTLEPAVGAIEQIERKPCPYYSSCVIEELEVRLAGGDVLQIIFKDLSPHAIFEKARVKPDFIYDSLREIETYRTILSRLSLGTAKCFATVAEQGRSWLFLENVLGELLWQAGDLEVWRNAARWLSRLHEQTLPGPNGGGSHLLCYDRAYYEQCWQHAAAQNPVLSDMRPVYERAVHHLLTLPVRLIHGEFYASNVLVQGTRICPIDWEMAAAGPALIDVAALTAGKWDAEERTDFVAAYCGGARPSAAMMHTLECCRLHLAVRLLGWSSDWWPPVAHAHDWRREALVIAENLT